MSTVDSFLTFITQDPTKNPKIVIRQYLEQLPQNEQLDHLLTLFQTTNEQLHHVSEIVVVAWAYLLESKVWMARYPSLKSLQHAIHFSETIQPILDATQRMQARTALINTSVYNNWDVLPADALPVEIRPQLISQHLARELSYLSVYVYPQRSYTTSQITNHEPPQHTW